MINVTSCVQSVIHLQAHMLEVSFATLQLLYQDGTPVHRARENVKLLKVETPDFIPPNMWPPNSPDLNPVDYKIWGILQERVYKTSSKDVDELRRRFAEKWDKLDQRIIDKAVGEWRKRLQASVAAGGGHFEQKDVTFIFMIFCIGILRPNSLKYCCFVQ